MLHRLSKKKAGSSTKFTTPAQGQNYRQGKPPARQKIAFLFVVQILRFLMLVQKRSTLFKRGLGQSFFKTVRSSNVHLRLGSLFAKNTFYASYCYYRRDLRCLKRGFTSHSARLSDRRICIGGLAFFSRKTLSTLLIPTRKEIYAV